MANRINVSIGHVGFWGYSSSFDVLEALLNANNCPDSFTYGSQHQPLEPINILLIHPGDIRHIMTTISKRQRHHGSRSRLQPLRPIHFYLLESPIQVLSRELLLLETLNDFEVPIRQRAAIFLEIFGNCKVQDRTCRYIEQLGHELRTFVTNGTGRLEGLVDLSLLRYREKDELEAAFKAYSRSTAFDMDTLRDYRLRGYYEDRYDSRKNLADWDYHQSLKSKASIIHIKQFKEWRLSGIAFELGDQVYCEPNRTLMSFAEGVIKRGKEKGSKTEVLGFWGDIVGGPYYSFGVDCDTPNAQAEGLFEILNKNSGTEQHRYHTVEIAMYSLFSLLWEIETGTVYRMMKKNDIYSGLGAEAGLAVDLAAEKDVEQQREKADTEETQSGKDDAKEKSESSDTARGQSGELIQPPLPPPKAPELVAEEDLAKAIQRAECIVDTLRDCKIFPMLGLPSVVLSKPRWNNFFDAVFVSARAASCVEHDWFKPLLKPQMGILALESSKFMVPLTKEQKAEFAAKEEAFALNHGFARMHPSPVFRRPRDEVDREDDVMFFRA